ncbi:hypothetical protein JG688_00008702 [Phytophthora aleatoria]|uniref:Uncharacterized protein n=1 Tax=Phytophthora aleatoria TaxID=2496075 RepID=A0A8J5IY29_9STRA|nr:hypothetical protein JG688_00008702 [Phytophthora aleatoria]
MRPFHIRSSTLQFAKKAISAFMPRLNTTALSTHHALQPTITLSSAQSPARISVARLSKKPKDQYELRYEHQFGCSGLKPAKEFTPVERGANKFAYSRRKGFWDVTTQLVRSGYASDAAIDKVYQVYGRQLSVSIILVSLHADRSREGIRVCVRLQLVEQTAIANQNTYFGYQPIRSLVANQVARSVTIYRGNPVWGPYFINNSVWGPFDSETMFH